MFEAYRAWLESELRLLGNASHHAYAIGQANMAKRALDRFDEAVRERTDAGASPVTISLGVEETRDAIDAIAALPDAGPALAALRSRLGEGLGRHEETRTAPVAGAVVRPLDPETLA